MNEFTTATKIESVLLEKELNQINSQLGKIGADLIKVFEKYGTIKGQHGDVFAEYIVTNVISANEGYFGGYTTRASIKSSAHAMPDPLKEAVLQYAVKEFLMKVEDMSDVIGELQ